MKWVLGLLVGAVVELYVVILVAGWLGFWSMLGLLVLVSLVGIAVMRAAGVRTVTRSLAAGGGQSAGKELADGALLFIGGLLMAVPGFVSGAIGLLLLLPPVRALVRPRIAARSSIATDRFRNRFGGTTVIATYDRTDTPDVRDASSREVRGELPDTGDDTTGDDTTGDDTYGEG